MMRMIVNTARTMCYDYIGEYSDEVTIMGRIVMKWR